MKTMKRVVALFLCIFMLASVPVVAIAETGDGSNGETVACSYCGSENDHVIGCFATFTEVNKTAAFSSYPVTLYFNPGTDPDNSASFTEEDFGKNFTFTVQYSFPGENGVVWYMLDTENWEIFANSNEPYSYIQSTAVLFDSDSDEKPERTLTDESTGVKVSGNLPDGISLSVKTAKLEDVIAIDSSLSGISAQNKVMDISLMNGGEAYQPGESVSVTMDVSDVASVGEKVFVYHVHRNEDGTVETEILGRYTIDSNGEIHFDMDKFSYVIVVNNDVRVENIQAFYTVTGTSNNNHFHASCIYITNTGDVHMILTGNQSQAAGCDATAVSVNNVPVTSLKETTNHGQVTSFLIKNAENENDITEIVTNGSKFDYVIDINLGTEVSLNGQFDVSVVWNDGTINGFKIEGMEVTVVFNEGIQKTVYSVNNDIIDYTSVPIDYVPEVNAGDEIVYKIEVKNGADSTQNLICDISDMLPVGLFDNNTIQISQDLSEWSVFSVGEDGKFNIASDIELKKGESVTYYVKAIVLNNADVGTYVNTARMSKSETNYKEDSATVEIKQKRGTLNVSKNVVKAYDGDTLPDVFFNFVLKDSIGNPVSGVSYKVGNETKTTDSNGMFQIKNGETAVFADLLAGEYTVIESLGENSKFTCGWESNTAHVEVTAGQENSVTCVNTYKRQLVDLTIKKTGWQTVDENQTFIFDVHRGDTFIVTVTIHGNSQVTIKDLPIGEYTVTEQTEWSWRYTLKGDNGKKITLVTNDENTVTFENERSLIYWLSGDSFCTNWWGGENGTVTNRKASN